MHLLGEIGKRVVLYLGCRSCIAARVRPDRAYQNEMVSATVAPAGRAIVMCVAVVAGILYGAYRVLSIGRRGRGSLPGMVGLLCFAPEMEVWRGGFVWDVDWIYEFRAADCVDFG